jgi:CrcB protein
MQMFTHTPPHTPSVVGVVAVGGAIGAAARWAVGTPWTLDPGTWPWATLLVNVLGSLAIGFAARRLIVGTIGWAFVVTGLLGGFTTFSALAVQLNALVEAERPELAIAYGAVTLIAGVGATLVARRGQPTQITP